MKCAVGPIGISLVASSNAVPATGARGIQMDAANCKTPSDIEASPNSFAAGESASIRSLERKTNNLVTLQKPASNFATLSYPALSVVPALEIKFLGKAYGWH